MSGYVNIGVAELQELMAKGNVTVVDVRTDAEVARGYIAGALRLPLHVLPLRLNELDAKRPTVFYCQTGGRSAQAAAFAAAQGFAEAYNLQGGVTAWVLSGGTVVTQPAIKNDCGSHLRHCTRKGCAVVARGLDPQHHTERGARLLVYPKRYVSGAVRLAPRDVFQ